MSIWKLFGNYPKEYNRAVHGPYYPFRDYRPIPKEPFGEVKLGDLKKWLARRDKSPQAIIASCSRYMSLWNFKWLQPQMVTNIYKCTETTSTTGELSYLGLIVKDNVFGQLCSG